MRSNLINLLSIIVAIIIGVALFVFVTPAHAGPRPSNSSGVELQSLGVPAAQRLLNDGGNQGVPADGGALSILVADAGPGCVDVPSGAMMRMDCESNGVFCMWGDGGCSNAFGTAGYGLPFALSVPPPASGVLPFLFMTEPTGAYNDFKQVCVIPLAGDATILCVFTQLK
jgi:hypothetical protein